MSLGEIGEITNKFAPAIQALSTVVLVGITIWYAASTKKAVELSDLGNKSQFLPVIVPSYFLTKSDDKNLAMRLKNVGKGIAKTPKIKCPGAADIQLNSLSPNESAQARVQHTMEYILQLQDSDRMLTIQYEDIFGRIHTTECHLAPRKNFGPQSNQKGLGWDSWKYNLPEG